MKSWRIWVVLALLIVGAGNSRAEVSFVREVAPILLKRCVGCHGEKANLGGYRVHTFQNLMKSGASGTATIQAGKPEASLLFQRLIHKNEGLRMPQNDEPLSPAQVGVFRRWIAEGAKFDSADPTAPLKSLLGPRRHPLPPAVYRAPVPVMALTFTPDRNQIVVGGYNEVTFWNAQTGKLMRRVSHLPQRIQSVLFDKSGGNLIVVGGTPGEYGEVAKVHLATGRGVTVLDTFPDIALAAALSADGARVAVGCADGSVRVYDWASGKTNWTSRVHSDWVTSVSFSPDGQFLISGSRDKTVKVYEADSGSLYTTYNGHNRQIGKYAGQAPVYAVQFSAENGLAYSAGGGRWIQAWNPVQARSESGDAGDMEDRFAKENKSRYLPTNFTQEVFAIVMREGRVFAASADGIVKQFDDNTLTEVRSYPVGKEWLFSLDYDPINRRIAVGSYNGEVTIWSTETGAPLLRFAARPGKQ